MNVDPSGLMVPLSLQDMGNAYVNNGYLNQAINNFERNLAQIGFNSQLPTVDMANANLKANGGSGADVLVNASRLWVEPNPNNLGWRLGPTSGRPILPIQAVGWLNEQGTWVRSGSPSQADRGYWVYGELTMSENLRIYKDPYDFELHNPFGNENFMGTMKRNGQTVIGAWNSGSLFNMNSSGYNHEFYGRPYCPLCPPIPESLKKGSK
ncbi:hypothetical protein [Acinetobacter populi]|nr:hypothetical protein [Acinetobacter populi]